MKHNKKITAIILLMFLLTQFIGLFVVNTYATQKVVDGEITNVTGKTLPYGTSFEETEKNQSSESIFISIVFSFVIAISIIFLLTKIKAKFFLKTWFFLVTILALGISLTAILPETKYASLFGLVIAIPLAVFKIYKRNILIHNATELLIYPGIATIFVQILGLTSIIILLILISIYDVWAVWKSKIMQKMAKFQMNELQVFGGFLVPYLSKKQKEKIKKLKKSKENLKKAKIKLNVAVLGGGDIVFPIITSGVVLKTLGLGPAIAVIVGAFAGLLGLLIYSEKKKFYPAMPFISAGIFIAMIFSWIFL